MPWLTRLCFWRGYSRLEEVSLHSPSHELGPARSSEPSRGKPNQRVSTYLLSAVPNYGSYTSSIASFKGELFGLRYPSWAIQVNRVEELAGFVRLWWNHHSDWDGFGHDQFDSGLGQLKETCKDRVHLARFARLVRWLHVHRWKLDRIFLGDLELQSDSKPTDHSPLQDAWRF